MKRSEAAVPSLRKQAKKIIIIVERVKQQRKEKERNPK